MAKILKPPHYEEVDHPLIFLGGPIQGAPDWQAVAIDLFRNIPDIVVASPRREGELPKYLYDEQVNWEHHYLDEAAKRGITLFWLAKEIHHICDRAYAQTTRFELGEAVSRHRLEGIKIVVGIEEGFSNQRYLVKTISKKASDIPLCATLEHTCSRALELLQLAR
ncbi:MAG: hypothetical protein A2939_00935 [Parcubacteria group bacterium RIFCSPLOWO2_01_FULL_48_18]|nr:MAG: hypothetical protein A3J67_04820 [Parcubacteria group bacterium RIFCSPHIGHO2_02_FULL_48_10b]OHB22039.1 MAG: hypothetical protein A2939_00935 [Parcubacteria group bacterium RIFCSPLOWO2_01_FULL_48_18]